MKKEYVSPEVEIDSFSVEDTVFTESSNPDIPNTDVDF